jgi:nucleoside-diphosphate-sugar epimerase
MAILVTGGTGFIGAEVVRILLKEGEKKVVVFHVSPSTKRLDDVADQVEVVRGDLGNFSHVSNAVQMTKPSVIFHLGGMLSVPSDADPAAAMQANVLGTFHVLEAARLYEVPQVVFSSSIGTYGLDIRENVINDYTLQRPEIFYGATKVFCEHMGLFYRSKYGLDFRGLRYPSIVGPGVRAVGGAQYTSWVIEACAKGDSYVIWVNPETRYPILYFRDAARAIVNLSETPFEKIKTVNYVLAGISPVPSAGELADIVELKVPGAHIDFTPIPQVQEIIDKSLAVIDDNNARKEWDWSPEYSLEAMVDDFLQELKLNPQRYDDPVPSLQI